MSIANDSGARFPARLLVGLATPAETWSATRAVHSDIIARNGHPEVRRRVPKPLRVIMHRLFPTFKDSCVTVRILCRGSRTAASPANTASEAAIVQKGACSWLHIPQALVAVTLRTPFQKPPRSCIGSLISQLAIKPDQDFQNRG